MPAMKSIIQFTCPQCGCLSDTRFWWTIYAESRWGTAARTAVIRIAMGMIHRKDFNGIP